VQQDPPKRFNRVNRTRLDAEPTRELKKASTTRSLALKTHRLTAALNGCQDKLFLSGSTRTKIKVDPTRYKS
jgi:hypothetical protein